MKKNNKCSLFTFFSTKFAEENPNSLMANTKTTKNTDKRSRDKVTTQQKTGLLARIKIFPQETLTVRMNCPRAKSSGFV